MSEVVNAGTTVPLLPCEVAVGELADFYRAIGFDVTHLQDDPYPYLTIQRGGIQLHFSRLSQYGAKKAFGSYLAFVPDVGPCHGAFADGLRAKYGKVPTAGLPRLSRLREGDTRFKVFDPSGNIGIFINQNEPETDYGAGYGELSEAEQALDNAIFLRDVYANDGSAAAVLDGALKRIPSLTPVERTRLLASRAELAVALGDPERAHTVREELRQIRITGEERERFREELEASERLERWIHGQ